MKKLIILLLFIITITGCSSDSISVSDTDSYFKNMNRKSLKTNDYLEVDYWNDKVQTLNNKKISGTIKTFNGVKIGTNKNEVISRFKLNSKNTKYNCEVVNKAYDGTTDVITGRFNKKIFNYDYLDCALTFGYKNGKMLTYSEINNITNSDDTPKGVTIYDIDINGFSKEEAVKKGEVIEFSIAKY